MAPDEQRSDRPGDETTPGEQARPEDRGAEPEDGSGIVAAVPRAAEPPAQATLDESEGPEAHDPATLADDADRGDAAADGPQADAAQAEAGEPLMSVDAVLDAGAASGQPAGAGVSEQLLAIVEALVFASPEPIAPKQLFKVLDTEPQDEVRAALAELQRRYEARGGALQIVEVAGGYQIVTRPDLHEWVRRLFHERTTQKLSVQALETLAVIAYKQPITAAEITEIRGVNASGVVGTLLERGLVKISGRKQVVGRPFLYSTTREFLDRFGLKDLNDLPKVEDMAEALGFEPPAGVPTAPLQSPLPADEPATEEDAAVISGEGEDADADSTGNR